MIEEHPRFQDCHMSATLFCKGKELVERKRKITMTDLKPKHPIHRFDVFAKYQRIKGLKEKMLPDEAKGYGIWLAKVVAARKFNRTRAKENKETDGPKEEQETLVDNKWRSLDGKPQTDDLFNKEIIQRMGDDFYKNVFSPAIEKAFESGKDYTEFRDTIRKDWKP